MLEFFNSYEGRELLVMGLEDVHYENFDGNTYDRIEENWEYDNPYYPLHFYLGQGVTRGYVPLENNDAVGDALLNVSIWESNGAETSLADTMAASSGWTGAPFRFQFTEFGDLSDTDTAITDAYITGWTEMITAAPDEFEAEWEEYLADLESAGFNEWTARYQEYYDENFQ